MSPRRAPALPPPAPGVVTPPPASRWRRIAVGVVCLAIAVFWLWVFLIGPEDNDESRLQDTRFTAAAEARCAQAREVIDRLPPAYTARSPEERAEVLAEANVEVEAMVRDLRALAPSDERDGVLVSRWLDDYDGYVEHRHTYAEALARGEDKPFAVEAVGGQPVTRRMDAFATLNDMPSCEVPPDV